MLLGCNNSKEAQHISAQSRRTAIISSRVVETHPKRGYVCFVYTDSKSSSISCLKDFADVEKK